MNLPKRREGPGNVQKLQTAISEFTNLTTSYVDLHLIDGLHRVDLRGIQVAKSFNPGQAVTDSFKAHELTPPKKVMNGDVQFGYDRIKGEYALLGAVVRFTNDISVNISEPDPIAQGPATYPTNWTTTSPSGTVRTIVKSAMDEQDARSFLSNSSLRVPETGSDSSVTDFGQLYNAAFHRIRTTISRPFLIGANELRVSDSVATVNTAGPLPQTTGMSSSRAMAQSPERVVKSRSTPEPEGSGMVQEVSVGLSDFEGDPTLMVEAILHRRTSYEPLRFWRILRHRLASDPSSPYNLYPSQIVGTEPVKPTLPVINSFAQPLGELLLGPQ